jgi:hypothetical protein
MDVCRWCGMTCLVSRKGCGQLTGPGAALTTASRAPGQSFLALRGRPVKIRVGVTYLFKMLSVFSAKNTKICPDLKCELVYYLTALASSGRNFYWIIISSLSKYSNLLRLEQELICHCTSVPFAAWCSIITDVKRTNLILQVLLLSSAHHKWLKHECICLPFPVLLLPRAHPWRMEHELIFRSCCYRSLLPGVHP